MAFDAQVGAWRDDFTLSQSAAFDEAYRTRMAGSRLETDFGDGDRYLGDAPGRAGRAVNEPSGVALKAEVVPSVAVGVARQASPSKSPTLKGFADAGTSPARAARVA